MTALAGSGIRAGMCVFSGMCVTRADLFLVAFQDADVRLGSSFKFERHRKVTFWTRRFKCTVFPHHGMAIVKYFSYAELIKTNAAIVE